MSNKTIETGSSGIGLGSALFIIFLILKLNGLIDWSWVWVTAPLWIPIGLIFAILIAGILFGITLLVIKTIHNKS